MLGIRLNPWVSLESSKRIWRFWWCCVVLCECLLESLSSVWNTVCFNRASRSLLRQVYFHVFLSVFSEVFSGRSFWMPLDPIWLKFCQKREPKRGQKRQKNVTFPKRWKTCLDRAGSIGLHVGPLQISPKIHEKPVGNPARFYSRLLLRKVAKIRKRCSQMSSRMASKWGTNM